MPWTDKEKYKEWYQKNREKRSEYHKQWRLKHKEQRKAYAKRWRQEHREQWLANKRQWWQNHREQARITNRAWRNRLKLEVLAHYGGGKVACVRCEFTDARALSIDHIDGKGQLHRKVVPAKDLYWWLRKNGCPKGYQTLCMNCQFIKREEDRIKNIEGS